MCPESRSLSDGTKLKLAGNQDYLQISFKQRALQASLDPLQQPGMGQEAETQQWHRYLPGSAAAGL